MKSLPWQVLRLRHVDPPAPPLSDRTTAVVPPLFYERSPLGVPLAAPSKLVVAVSLGVALLAVHRWSAGPAVFQDFSWVVGALVTIGMLCLFYATHTLRTLVADLVRSLPRKARPAFRISVAASLNNAVLLRAGLFFGLANCGMALAFGAPSYVRSSGVITYYLGIFSVGFVCGTAVGGILAVMEIVRTFCRSPRPRLDYASPDGCGGLLFVGQALVKFASVTLLMGVLIALYIVTAPWTREAVWAEALKQLWIAFPFLASVGVLLVPAEEIHRLLRAYSAWEDRRIQRRMLSTRGNIHDASLDPATRRAFQEEYDYLARLRTEVSQMRTWPFNFVSGGKYVGIFGGHLSVVWTYVSKLEPRLGSWIP